MNIVLGSNWGSFSCFFCGLVLQYSLQIHCLYIYIHLLKIFLGWAFDGHVPAWVQVDLIDISATVSQVKIIRFEFESHLGTGGEHLTIISITNITITIISMTPWLRWR